MSSQQPTLSHQATKKKSGRPKPTAERLGSNKPLPEAHTFLVSGGIGKSIRAYQKNQEIFVQGQYAKEIFYIQYGRIKLSVASKHGKDAVVGILEPGQFVGEACIAGHRLRTATAIAMEECLLTSITESAMRAALRNEPGLCQTVMTYLLTRNSRIEEDLIDQLFNSSEKRLARLLLLLANYGQEGTPPVISVTLTQETLAEMIGTTRSRVSFFMNRFRNSGYISYAGHNGTIEVHRSLLDSVLREKPMIRQDEYSAA